MKTLTDLKAKLALVLIALAIVVGIYTILVTPRRFLQCLKAPAKYITRNFGGEQQAAIPQAVPGNRVEVLVNGNEALPAMLELIAGAQESIRWQVMLFQPDEAGRTLADALVEAANRGVRVQFSFNIDQTVNGTIADQYPKEKKERLNREMEQILSRLRRAGVDVRANPSGVDSTLAGVDPGASAIQREIQANVCISANHYDHRKLLIADNRRAIIGGMNVGNSYLYRAPVDWKADMVREARERLRLGQPEAWEKWFDVSFVVEGPVLAELVEEFDWKWQVLGGEVLAKGTVKTTNESPDRTAGSVEGVPVRFLRQYPGRREAGAAFFDLVSQARQEIFVASPFISYDPALQALQAASRRGVRVVFITPGEHQEMAISGAVFRQSAEGLVDAGVELYFNDLRMAHTKLMVVDGRQVMFGSFNLNYRSFLHDLEVAAVVEDETLASQVIDRVFRPYLNISRRADHVPSGFWNPLLWLVKPFT